MKEISYIKRGIALFLAFWLLFTSIGFSVDFHYCGDVLVDWSVFGEAEKCEHGKEKTEEKPCCAKEESASCHEENATIEKSDCCSSDVATFQLADNFKVNSLTVEISQPTLLFLTSFVYPVILNNTKEVSIFYTNSSPPILDKQGLTFIQTFLI